ncbi:hypothetical protein [Saccharothrix sp. NRRL B-16348]|uniref:hypothetical protein n=1 Tax=Saccharothrix sp. NRRL B-16348 TaxID=1415542 RepID=UPI000A4BF269|nr:hypothetical protein [Saccharothrix sp. NRRL B-16348]
MADKAADYERAASAVREHVRKFERALNAVRRTHRGRPVDEVRQALVIAVGQEGLRSADDVLTDAARLISTEADS